MKVMQDVATGDTGNRDHLFLLFLTTACVSTIISKI